MALISEKADSAKIAETLKPYAENSVKLSKVFKKEVVKDFINNEFRRVINEMMIKKTMYPTLSAYDSLITDSLLKDIFEAQKFYWLLDYKKASMSDEMYREFTKRVTNPALAAPIIKLQEYYSQLSKQDILYVESMKNTDHLKDAKDADALFASLSEQKDKLVNAITKLLNQD